MWNLEPTGEYREYIIASVKEEMSGKTREELIGIICELELKNDELEHMSEVLEEATRDFTIMTCNEVELDKFKDGEVPDEKIEAQIGIWCKRLWGEIWTKG
jgi:hypothetical protein